MTDLSLPVFGPLAWIDVILLAWFALTALSVIYVAHDAFTNNPELKVMRLGWVLVTLYLGPFALFLYVMSGTIALITCRMTSTLLARCPAPADRSSS